MRCCGCVEWVGGWVGGWVHVTEQEEANGQRAVCPFSTKTFKMSPRSNRHVHFSPTHPPTHPLTHSPIYPFIRVYKEAAVSPPTHPTPHSSAFEPP